MEYPDPGVLELLKRYIQSPSGYPLFSDWSHLFLDIFRYPPEYRPDKVVIPIYTNTLHHLIVAYIPLPSIQQKTQHFDDPIYFWSRSAPGAEDDYKTMEANIELAYGKDKNRITRLIVNPDIDEIELGFEIYKKLPGIGIPRSFVRSCFQFVTDNSQRPFPPPGQLDPMFQTVPFAEALRRTSANGVHIIDCDFAGSLIPLYKRVLSDMRAQGKKTDVFAFFSCAADERNPRSPGLPSDLFSSCLNSPGKMALLWHSSHYYCFKAGPLQPINIDDFSSASPELIKTVDAIFRGFVEAMVSEYMPHQEFVNLFHCNEFVGRSFCGFVMAQKIFDLFNVHPISDPPLPDFRNNPSWKLLSLRLDEALAMFREPQQCYKISSFLEYDLTTVNLLLESDADVEAYLPYLSVWTHILENPDLAHEGLRLLCKFMDKSMKGNEMVWLFPMINQFNEMLDSGSDDPYLLLVIAKSMVYAPQCRKKFHTTIDTVFIKSRLLQLCCKKETAFIATVLFAMNYHFFPAIDDKEVMHGIVLNLIRTPWKDCIDTIMDIGQDSAVWALIFVASIVQDINSQNFDRIYYIVAKRLNNSSPIVRAAALNAIVPFAVKTTDNKVFEAIHPLINDISPVVRSQFLCSLTTLYHIAAMHRRNEIIPLIIDDVKILAKDPFINIAEKAKQFLESPRVIPSYIFEHLALQFLGPVSEVLENPGETLETLQTKTTKLRPDENIKPHTLKRTGTIELTNPVSSNLSITHDSTMIFGSSNGNIGAVHINSSPKAVWSKLSTNEITFITTPIPEIAIVSDVVGNIYSLRYGLINGAMNLVSTFRAPDFSSRIKQMSCSAQSRMLAILPTDADRVSLIDLASEKSAGFLKPTKGKPKFVHVLDNFRDLSVVCSDVVEFFDIRSSLSSPVYTISSEKAPFDCQFAGVHRDITVAYGDGSVAHGDWRQSPETFRIAQPPIDMLETCSYSAHSSCRMCVLGTNRGVSTIDLETNTQSFHSTVTSSLFSSEKLHPVTKVAMHPNRLFSASLVQNQEIITFAEF